MDDFSEILKALVLGVVQGLTEFLPVSSSGHLEISKILLGSKATDDESLMMTVVLHAATALSTVIVFRKEIAEILLGLLKFKWNEDWQFAAKIILSMIPAVAVGLLLEDQIESLFGGQLVLVGCMLVVTAALLWMADKAKNTDKDVSFPNAFWIGIAQAIAILPGISRSGATISTSVLLGIDRMKAAKFSFLMVIPLILGKMAKDILSGDLASQSSQLLPLLAGFVAALVTGVIACKWMISLVRNCQLWWFSLYCLAVGLIAVGCGLFSPGLSDEAEDSAGTSSMEINSAYYAPIISTANDFYDAIDPRLFRI
ncbi:MAG: undecaprenyl-diphosphate phosphatase [Pirellulaceae bacterium]